MTNLHSTLNCCIGMSVDLGVSTLKFSIATDFFNMLPDMTFFMKYVPASGRHFFYQIWFLFRRTKSGRNLSTKFGFFQTNVWRSLPIQLANCSLAAAVLSCAHTCMKLD